MKGTSELQIANNGKKRSHKEEERREITCRKNMFKKAHELAVLTGCELALIVNSANGIRHQLVQNTSMPEIMEKFQRDYVVQDLIAPKEDNAVHHQEDNLEEASMDMSLTEENVHALSLFQPKKNKHMKPSKRDMHEILDSYGDQEIDMFEQMLNQNRIDLLKKKVILIENEIEGKWKEVCISAAEKMQHFKEIENKRKEINQLKAELREFENAQNECLSRARNKVSQGIEFDSLEKSDVASTSGSQGVRNIRVEEVRFDILERSDGAVSSSGYQEREKVAFHVERGKNAQDMDLELCLGFPCWKSLKV